MQVPINTGFVSFLPIIVAAAVSLVSVRWVYFKVLHIAKEKGLVDNPDARKLQKEPIPVVGGIAVFFGVMMGLLASSVVFGLFGGGNEISLIPIAVAMVVMLYVGATDDLMGLSAGSRFVIEILTILGIIYAGGGCIDTFHGLWGIDTFSWWLAVPLTVFAGVGIINAVNMVDGVNGLSSMLCILCCVLYGIFFIHSDDIPNAVLAFAEAAALLPFVLHNVFGLRSRMFIGDAGTMVMGVLLTWFTICLLRSDSPVRYYEVADGINLIAFSLAVLCVPVFDTVRVMTMRMARKKSPFSPDKTHLHHIFVNIGVSHFITTMSEVVITLVVISGWFISTYLGVSQEWQLYIVLATAMLMVWGTYVLLLYHASHHTELLHRLVNFSVHTHLGRTRWWKCFTAYLDAPEDRLLQQLKKEQTAAHAPHPVGPIDPSDHKEMDRKRVLDFMRGRAEVMVYDIIKNSGADRLRVYPLLLEEVQRGHVRVIQHGQMGAPEIVALIG